MSRFNFLLVFIVINLSILKAYSQTKYNGSQASKVIQLQNIDAAELHSRLNYAIANIFNSANDVVQLNDSESKRIVVKGLAEIPLYNAQKALYPKMKMIPEYYDYNHDITLNIASRDGRCKIILSFSNGKIASTSQYSSGYKDLEYPPKFNFTDSEINEFVDYWKRKMNTESGWGLIGKKKKQLYLDNIPKTIRLYEKSLKKYAESLFIQIEESIKTGETISDDW